MWSQAQSKCWSWRGLCSGELGGLRGPWDWETFFHSSVSLSLKQPMNYLKQIIFSKTTYSGHTTVFFIVSCCYLIYSDLYGSLLIFWKIHFFLHSLYFIMSMYANTWNEKKQNQHFCLLFVICLKWFLACSCSCSCSCSTVQWWTVCQFLL